MQPRSFGVVAVFFLICVNVSVRAQQGRLERELIVPIVAAGGIDDQELYKTTFTFMNQSTTTVQGAVQVFDDAGRPVTQNLFCPNSLGGLVMTSFRLRRGEVEQLATAEEIGLSPAWAKIVFTSPDEDAEIFVSAEVSRVIDQPAACPIGPICHRASDRILSTTQLRATAPARQVRVPVIISEHRNTALAIVNPSMSETALVTFALSNLGNVCAAQLELSPGQRVTGFAWEVLSRFHVPPINASLPCEAPPEQPRSLHAGAWIRSSVPVAVGALHLLSPEGKIVNIPVSAER